MPFLIPSQRLDGIELCGFSGRKIAKYDARQKSTREGDDDRCDEHALQGCVIVSSRRLRRALCQIVGDDDPANLGGAGADAAKRGGQAASGGEAEAAGIEADDLDALPAR